MTMRTATIVGALLSFSAMIHAQISLDTSQVKLDTLSNGLKVVISRDTNSNLSVLSLGFHAGSKYDDADQSGVAYLVHQLLINEDITDYNTFGSKEVLNYMTGGQTSRKFTKDYSIYRQVFTSEQLEEVLKVEASRLSSDKFSTRRLNMHRKLLLEESNFTTSQLLSTQLPIDTKLYKNHPYENKLKGSVDLVEGTTNSEVRNFVRKYYAANRAVLVINSPIEQDSVLKLVEQNFSNWPKGSFTQTSFPLPNTVQDSLYTDTLKTNTLALPTGILAFPIPMDSDTIDILLETLGECLFDFENFFLSVDQTLNNQLSFFDAKYKNEKDASYWVFQFTPKLNVSLDTLFQSMDSVLTYYKDSLIAQPYWQDCCLIRNNASIDQENNIETRNASILKNMLLMDKPFKSTNIPLTREKFRLIINEYFRPEKSLKLVLLPSRIH